LILQNKGFCCFRSFFKEKTGWTGGGLESGGEKKDGLRKKGGGESIRPEISGRWQLLDGESLMGNLQKEATACPSRSLLVRPRQALWGPNKDKGHRGFEKKTDDGPDRGEGRRNE